MRVRCLLYLPIVLVGFLLVACAPEPQLRNTAYLPDTSIVNAEAPCTAPCWHDVTPGETPWLEAFRAVATDDDFQNFSQDRRAGTAHFSFQDGPQCCRLYTRDGEILASITLLTTPQVNLSEVIDRYGDPTYIRGDAATNTQAFVSLYYINVPMVVYIFATNLSSAELAPTNDVIGYVYMSASEMDRALQMTEDFYEWTGYGTLVNAFASDPVAATTP